MEIAQENYLKIIYMVQIEQNAAVKAGQLALALRVSNAAVTDMLKKLADNGDIKYSKYKGVSLTPQGEQKGMTMVRRHRIWELFLQKVVGLSWDQVHSEAERLEHASSDELVNRLEELMDYPSFDPHGDPIPSRKGCVPDQGSLNLLSLKIGQAGIVKRVNDQSPALLQYLDHNNIGLGSVIIVKHIHLYDSSLEIEVNQIAITISEKVAKTIIVEKKF